MSLEAFIMTFKLLMLNVREINACCHVSLQAVHINFMY